MRPPVPRLPQDDGFTAQFLVNRRGSEIIELMRRFNESTELPIPESELKVNPQSHCHAMDPEGFGKGEGSGMRWSLLVAVCGLSILDAASFAQGPRDGERLSRPRSASDDSGFFASTGVVRFQLIQGRLCLDCPRHRKGSQTCHEHGIYENITVTALRGIPSLHYVCQSESHHLTLSVQHGDSMRIESWLPLSDQRSVLEQPDTGKLTWVHTRGDLNEQHEGTNLLHLRHADPVTFDEHFGVLIQRLLRGQSLELISDATERLMLREAELAPASDPATVDHHMIQQCVEQLRSDRRAMRIEAERQLLAWGTPIIPALHEMIDGDIDAEQRARLRLIMKRLRPMIDDTPATLAKLFVNDRSYWTRIATGLDGRELHSANLHLTTVGIKPIEVPSEPAQRIANAGK